jgi:hypothetical protein
VHNHRIVGNYRTFTFESEGPRLVFSINVEGYIRIFDVPGRQSFPAGTGFLVTEDKICLTNQGVSQLND